MLELSELFWASSPEEMKSGYVYDQANENYICLVCGLRTEKGVVYPDGERWLDARKSMQHHIQSEHKSMFDYLLGLDKRFTGLTDLQSKLIRFFHDGMSDVEIVREMNGGSSSTIRNHRFTLREKMKQAKVFLALMEMMEEQAKTRSRLVPVHRTATMVDERYAITEEENAEVIKTYFKSGPDGPLTEFPKKEKRKLAILRQLVRRFEPGRKYSEKEVNEVLRSAYADFATLRRYLIEYGFLDREPDCTLYWVKS